MSLNYNHVVLVGRLTAAPETRTTTTGQTVASLRMATNRTWTDKTGQKQEKSEFHSIVAWGKLAEICGQYLTKGQELLIEGRIETRTWDDQAGVKHWRTEIVAETMQMGSRPRGAGDFTPAPAAGSNPAPTDAPPQPPPAPEEEVINVEEIPF